MTPSSSQVDFTSCGGFLAIAAVLLMIIGIVTAIVLSFQYVRTPLDPALSREVVIRVVSFKSRRLFSVTQQVPWLHMLYAAIGAIIYTLVGAHSH